MMRAIDLFAGAGGFTTGAELAGVGRVKHGLSYTPEYRVWQTMRLRCTSPTNAAWPSYGGRGITICKQWLDDPMQFCLDMGKRPSPQHEIDRIDNDAGYSPENCRWVLRNINDRNRRSNRRLEFAGYVATLVEWSERVGIKPDTITKRLDAGWSIEKALTTPPRGKAANGCAKGDKANACADCGVASVGTRCQSCENKSRGKRRAIVARDVIQALRAAA